MSDIRKLLDIISESTVAGAVASVPAAGAPVQKRMEETAQETNSPEVLEYGMWENSALATTGKLKKTRQKSAKIVKSIYGESQVNEGTQPRIRKYTKERPNGTKMERWEVLDKAGKRVKEFDSKELAQKYLKDNKFDLMYEGVAESSDKLQGTPVVSLSDFSDRDNTKNKYGQTVPKKLKKDDPRVKFHKEPEKQDVGEDQLDEVNWKNAIASGAMALSALGGAANAQAADEPVQQTTATTVQQAPQQKRDLSSFSSEYLQKASNPNGGRYMISPEEAKAELQARENGTSQQKPAAAPSVQKSSGYSKEYLQSVVNGTHPRPMISVERAQELLNQMQVNEAEISEEQLLTAKLKKELELLKKEKSKEISSKPADKEIQRKK